MWAEAHQAPTDVLASGELAGPALLIAAARERLGIAGLLVEVVGDADGDLATAEKKRSLEEEGCLVVE